MKDFHWEIEDVVYKWKQGRAKVWVNFWENHNTETREFDFVCPDEWTSDNVIEKLFELPQFANSVPAEV